MNLFYKILITLLFFTQQVFLLDAQNVDYYIDAVNGNDDHSGTEDNPWKTIDKVSNTTFQPGDNIYFKRSTSYSGCVTINGNGTADNPITIGAYGSGDSPSFTNPEYSDKNGNAMRIRGDYLIVEKLYFHHTAPAPEGGVPFQTVWAVGALHISLDNDYVIVRNNEFAHNAKAIQSYSEYSLITENYIHDANTTQQNGFLSSPWWGPIGIQLGIGNQEVSYNTIENMYAEGGNFGGDGGALEVDDGRNHKDNIYIHHNTTFHNMGFMEVSYWDDIQMMSSNNIEVEYNISRDYQSFLLWWAPTTSSLVKNNTIIRDDNQVEGPWNGVFFFDAPPGDIDLIKNIVVVDNNQTESIFIQGFDGAIHDVNHANNCYWNVDGGNIDLGLSFGAGEITSDPQFIDYSNSDYYLQEGSPATGWGALVMEDSTTTYLVEVEVDQQDIIAYPNPSNGLIQLTFSGDKMNSMGKLLLMDFTGRKLEDFKTNGHNLTIDLTPYPSGNYIVQYGTITKKLIKR